MTALNPITDAFVEKLTALLPNEVFRDLEPRYLEENRGRFTGSGGILLAPRTTNEVATIVKAAFDAKVGIVPYGGGTGLVGGQISADGPTRIILSLERMTAIRSIHPFENVLVAEAGAILADVQQAATDIDRLFPLSLAAEGSARIGGILSTNAGGVNVLRYGNARDLCLGLEVVTPSGDIWNGLTRLRKNNTGYDLRNLMIGAEGTLGIITAAALKLHPIPATIGTAVMAVRDPQAALELLSMANDAVAGGVSAFELMHKQGFEFLSETMPQVRLPFEDMPEWMVLIEVGLPQGLDPATCLENLFVTAHAAGLVSDGHIAQNQAQATDFWTVRESIPEANRHIGSVSSHDISVPLEALPEFITRGTAAISNLGPFRVNCFGHVGDGNLHFNVFPPKGRDKAEFTNQRDAIKSTVHDLTHELGGSVSAEHGIGRLKVGDLQRYSDPTKLAMLRAIKTALDPMGIMNPGAVLPERD